MKKVFCIVFVAMMLSACDSDVPKMTVVVSVSQTERALATPTPVATKTLVPTREPTRTASQTPTITETPTLTSSPLPTPTKETPVVINKDNISRLAILTEFEMETGQQLAWYPDSKKFAILRKTDTASNIYLYDVNNFQEMTRVEIPDPGVYNYAFSSDGSDVRLASLYGVGIWDLNSGEPIRDLPNNCVDPIMLLSQRKSTFGNDGNVAVFGESGGRGEYDTNVKAIDISSCASITSVHHEGWLVTLSLSPDGSHLISTAAHMEPETLFVWDTATGELTCKTPWAFSTPIFSPESKFFVALNGSQDQYHISLFDTQTCQSVQNFDREAFSYNFSLDGQLLFSADRQGIQVWDVTTGKLIKEINDPENRYLSISPDGRYLISIRGDFDDEKNIFRVWAIVQ